ncbi:hypothetical protein PPERSA_05520 [Pseudocohnilembus persalinus]|uniref:VPS10 domain-containing protein n=1 Tax=Pseudocohnilembus persalinus TaxID=266149 RepID=A0A0V0QCV9_PSEPJ|nr:hypothetical protein PPERSA_05520 [Pseudocohnilembus persalinus]|eukprot:KRX00018.1 hypothetical protein PPERSA_05520 [Pseudocohnilembus persalinus]
MITLTNDGNVYRSIDFGFNWQILTDVLYNAATRQSNLGSINIGKMDQVHQSPVDSNIILVQSNNGYNFISQDCGATFITPGLNYKFSEFSFHPVKKDVLLGSFWNKCDKGAVDCIVTKQLFITHDLGTNWKKISDFIVQFEFAYLPNYDNYTPLDRIIYSKQEESKQSQYQNGWDDKTHLYYSDDFLKTSQQLVSQGNRFIINDSFILVAQSKQNNSVKLLVADLTEKDYNFQKVQIPEEIDYQSFTILDSSQNSFFINVNDQKSKSSYGTVYKSDSSGGKFVKALDNNVKNMGNGQCDFTNIEGVHGIYISNIYSQEAIDQFNKYQNSEKAEQEQLKNQNSNKGGRARQNRKNILKDQIQSRITFDMGSYWQPISAPVRDSEGKNIYCRANEGCSLHLHSISSNMQYGPVYSSKNAHGIVMATGNIGQSLQFKQDQVNTYLSRDAGLTWYEVRKGSYMYEFSDHGGLIIMAQNQQETNTVLYTWDEGLTWNTLQFIQQPIEVTNIITEPSNIGQRFLIIGQAQISDNNQVQTQGLVVALDFSTVHQVQCQGAESPNTPDSDYELWSPNGLSQPDCLLGANRQFVRRKRQSKCFNGQQFERQVKIDFCQCTESDWECDFGYARENGQGPCKFVGEESQRNTSPPDTCNGYYTVSKGYRKVTGDVCQGGIDYSPYIYTCPYFNFTSSNFWVNLLILSGLGALIYYVYHNQEKSLSTVLELMEQLQNLANKLNLGSLLKQKQSGYVDFSNYDFEKNNIGGAFDESLVSGQDEEISDGQKLDNLKLENNDQEEGELIKEDDKQKKINKQIQNSQGGQNKKNEENGNLLDEYDSGDEYDGFNPRK